jgi:uncharacterized protein
MPLCFLSLKGEDILLAIKVQPRASRRGIVGIYGERLKVAVNAAPEKGKANRELVQILAGLLRLPKGDIEVVCGHGSRDKTLAIKQVVSAHERDRIEKIFSGLLLDTDKN